MVPGRVLSGGKQRISSIIHTSESIVWGFLVRGNFALDFPLVAIILCSLRFLLEWLNCFLFCFVFF